MSAALALEIDPVDTVAPVIKNGDKAIFKIEDSSHYASSSILENIPGYTNIYSIETTGGELGALFTKHPELPGIMLFDGGQFTGVISQNLYYKCVSRAFGREIHNRRRAALMLEEATEKPLILDSNCKIQEAVDHCLARSRDYLYEPFLVYNQKSRRYTLCSFQVLILAASQVAALRNHQMQQILNSVTDGLLVIDKDFRIGSEYSKVTERLFERADLQDLTLLDALAPLIDGEALEELKEYLHILFDPKLIDRLIKTINPVKQISALFAPVAPSGESRVKHFIFNFERIRAKGGITQILVSVEDITQSVNMAKELEQQEAAAEEKLQFVMQLLQAEPADLNRFTGHFNEALAEMGAVIEDVDSIQNPVETVNLFFRKAHTLKGESSFLKLSSHTQALHRFEDRLQKLRIQPELKAEDIGSLRTSLDALQQIKEQVDQATEQLRSLGQSQSGSAAKSNPINSAADIDLIDQLARLIDDLNQRLNKSVLFYTDATKQDFPEAHRPALQDILIHLARNSMVHGIESSEVRSTIGKSSHGAIQLAVKTHADFYEIIFQDDGKGLDYDRIKARAGALGLKVSTPESLSQVIFEPGFSTAEEVTELAGRGVGLDAIRDAVQKMGGHIVPHSEIDAYCAFQIVLPLQKPATSATP